jgi:WD40 repeat protein
VKWSPSDRILATGGADRRVKLWDLTKGEDEELKFSMLMKMRTLTMTLHEVLGALGTIIFRPVFVHVHKVNIVYHKHFQCTFSRLIWNRNLIASAFDLQ